MINNKILEGILLPLKDLVFDGSSINALRQAHKEVALPETELVAIRE